jgi:enamidase
MRRLLACACFALLCAQHLAAQDLVITNAHIIDGNGGVIPRGTVVVRNGRIASVAAGTTAAPGLKVIDAKGMTVMPGLIDAHRHIIQGNPDQWLKDQSAKKMQEFLDAGFTTILSAGDPLNGILELRRRLAAGEIAGPRLIAAGRVETTVSSEQARAGVQMVKKAGVDVIKTRLELAPDFVERTPEGKAQVKATLAAIVDEGKKVGLPVIIHASTVPDMMASVEAHVTRLVHTPHGSWLSPEDAKKVAQSGIPVTSTISFGVPAFGVFGDRSDNTPRFRDGKPWPAWVPGGTGRPAGEKAVNGRTLFDAGVLYGYGTDTGFLPKDSLAHELRPLNLVFSAKDIIQIMTKNTAAWLDMSKDLGTLEAGKQADIVIIDGDPLEQIFDLLKVKTVIQKGKVVVDKRQGS